LTCASYRIARLRGNTLHTSLTHSYSLTSTVNNTQRSYTNFAHDHNMRLNI